ncbi:Ras-related protein [Schistosoma japonicum]|uniref:Ras-related protein n=2 Tax=Schistosoma TaxID=6181 RepID=Q5DGE6_SCHJA|nr:SJCHGC06157 protein [Schistosoma japonicum]KAH8851242.1 Ras-related protein Rab-18A [Schistosoma japonicum]KAH8851243.1 Ras-related protein Rab-18A [Schistosoma japonicum]TNN10186.1 Ras-related protein [Schistosoma japonicum]TNN10187.1 Ras-related protein [Schistosoma japonicum]
MHRNGNELLINFKLLLIGDSGVGKSSLLMRYTNDCFESQLSATIGVDFKVKLVTVPDGTKIKLSIWDTAGQERFRTLTPNVYRGSHAAVFVYDVANRESFDNLKIWMEELKTYSDNPNMIKLLVGNKIDSVPRLISREEGLRFARLYNMPYAETSAKTSEGVNQLFSDIVTKIFNHSELWNQGKKRALSNESNRANLTSSQEMQSHSGCCS